MRKSILAATVALMSAAPACAQENVNQPSSGSAGSVIRQPSSSSIGSSSGVSGNVGAPSSTYPGRLPDYNNPSASYGRPIYQNNGVRPNRR